MASERDDARKEVGNERAQTARSHPPGETRCKPERQRGRDQIGRDEHIHRQQKDETA